MEHSKENSEKQAGIIICIAPMVQSLDIEYCKDAADRMMDDGNRYDSVAPMVSSYNPDKGRLIRMKANALKMLAEYAQTIKDIQKLSAEIKETELQQSEINDLFGF